MGFDELKLNMNLIFKTWEILLIIELILVWRLKNRNIKRKYQHI